MTSTARLVPIDNSDFREKIKKKLRASGLRLSQLFQLDNKLLKIKFEQELENLKHAKPEGFTENILHLYHGTTANLDHVCDEGLDERLSRKGRFGKGIYFSDDPSKCCKYAEKKNSSKDKYLLICKVILGDIKEYPDGSEDRTLTKEPLKDVINGKRIFYDSVKGKPCHHTEYVIYEKRRILIEYVAYYEKDEQFSGENSSSGSSESDSDTNSESGDESTESFSKKQQVKANLEREQKAALMQLAQMKHVLKKAEFDDLIKSFQATYGKSESYNME